MNVSLFKSFATCKPTHGSQSLPQRHKHLMLAAVGSQCGCWEEMFCGVAEKRGNSNLQEFDVLGRTAA